MKINFFIFSKQFDGVREDEINKIKHYGFPVLNATAFEMTLISSQHLKAMISFDLCVCGNINKFIFFY